MAYQLDETPVTIVVPKWWADSCSRGDTNLAKWIRRSRSDRPSSFPDGFAQDPPALTEQDIAGEVHNREIDEGNAEAVRDLYR